MWPEFSSVNAVHLVKKSAAIPEISNYSYGITFLARPVMLTTHISVIQQKIIRPAGRDSRLRWASISRVRTT